MGLTNCCRFARHAGTGLSIENVPVGYCGEGLRSVAHRLQMVHASAIGLKQWKHDTVGEGILPFETVSAILDEIGYKALPALEIIAHNADDGVLSSMDKLAAMDWAK